MVNDIATYADKEAGILNVVIDIPAGSNNKYEYDHEMGCFVLDRVVHHSMFYPFNYGFLPQTLSKDGDPCDVCLYTTNPLFTGCVVKARPIGILYTSDDAGEDPKIIAVPVSKVDPRFDEIQTIDDLGAHKKKELEILFKEIKKLEAEIERLKSEIARSTGILSNEGFIAKAPAAKIENEKQKLEAYQKQYAVIEERLNVLKK